MKKNNKRRAKPGFYIFFSLLFILFVVLVSLLFILVCKLSDGYETTEHGSDIKYTEQSVKEPDKPYGEGFLIDIKPYEEYINPTGDDINAFLSLEGKTGKEPTDLENVDYENVKGEVKLRKTAKMALEAMLKEMKAEGVKTLNDKTGLELTVTGGYKSGDGEKCLGLTVDIHNCQTTDVSFATTDAFIWLKENCARFGFVLRYDNDKVKTTGTAYRPWEFRFVGRTHALLMKQNGLCLEEYVGK